MPPSETKGDFDPGGQPKKGGKATIAIDCSALKNAKGFDGVITGDGSTIYRVAAHELLHAVNAKRTHGDDDDEDSLAPHRNRENAVEAIGNRDGKIDLKTVTFKGRGFTLKTNPAAVAANVAVKNVPNAVERCTPDNVNQN